MTTNSIETVQNSLDSSVIPKAALAHMRNVSPYVCGMAFGIVADSETRRHDEAIDRSLQIKNASI